MIDIEIDGVWCPKCKTLHPTLYWHEKYDNWLVKRKEKHPEICQRFGINTNYLDGMSVIESKGGKCVVCGCDTDYADKKTRVSVCSDECRYNILDI